MPTREDEWQRIYDALLDFLNQFGQNGIYPPGDYWLVEDDWGEAQQKICVFDDHVLTPEFVRTLQSFLLATAPDWQVIVAINFAEEHMPENGMGLRISGGYVDYDWDLPKLRRILGNPLFFPA